MHVLAQPARQNRSAVLRTTLLLTSSAVVCATAWLPLPAAATAAAAAAAAAGFDLQAHRGGRGLWPENTLGTFENALRLGVSTLELDIVISAEGVPVISHDPALNPALTRGGQGAWLASRGPLVKDLNLAQLQSYDVGRLDPGTPYARQYPQQVAQDGARIPTLAALFGRVKALGADRVHFNIETKINPERPDDTPPPEPFVRAVLAVIQGAGMQHRATLQSFDWRSLQWARQLAPELPRAYLTVSAQFLNNLRDGSWTAGHRLEDHGGSVPQLVRAAAGPGGQVLWSPFHQNLDAAAVKEAQLLGLRVVPWTVNDASQMDRLIDWGVDGIITDYPDRLRDVMARRGLALPPGLPAPSAPSAPALPR